MKTQTIDGVPYLINEKGEVFLYSSVPPIQLGTYNKEAKLLNLCDDWQEKSKSWLEHFRQGLKTNTTVALQKAAELQKAA
jgi:hypothetical protein